jgi:hypothetical protein
VVGVSKLPKEVEWKLIRALAELIKEGYESELRIAVISYDATSSCSTMQMVYKYPSEATSDRYIGLQKVSSN